MKLFLDEGAIAPTLAHDTDAGWDLYTRDAFVIEGRGNAIINTGVHIQIPKGFVGFIKSKSGLNVNKNITSDGVIDSGYTGPIVVKLYNNGNEPRYFKAGDKITQLVVLPIMNYTKMVLVDSFDDTERGDNGFGSSGR